MTDVTICIPIGPGHEAVAQRAITSARAQTVPAVIETLHDTDGRGPGWARNRLLETVITDYVVFLDADDVIAPTFLARTLPHASPDTYVYTDWYEGARRVTAPATPWVDAAWHVITTLLPTGAAREAGFDEGLPGAEDTDFYLRLRANGVCGRHLPDALFAYAPNGGRAHAFVHSDAHDELQTYFTEQYGTDRHRCAGINRPVRSVVDGHPDGVEAVALWRGNRRVRGAATGHLYPRAGNEARMTVHPADIAAAPHQFQRIVHRDSVPGWVPADDAPVYTELSDIGAALGFRDDGPPPQRFASLTTATGPDVARLLALYDEAVRDG